MEFDEIVVKESPGLCRCCLSEGCYKDLGSEYTWMNETEVYADMLLECFDIGVSTNYKRYKCLMNMKPCEFKTYFNFL